MAAKRPSTRTADRDERLRRYAELRPSGVRPYHAPDRSKC